MEFQIALTDPTPEQLKEVALKVENLTINGIEDKEGFAEVKKNRLLIRDMRVTIEKQCKAHRDDAIKFQKDVIAYEKGLIALIEPAEKKLKLMEDEIKELEILEKRKASLPIRMKYLEAENALTEERNYMEREQFVLSMDDDTFAKYTEQIREIRRLELERIEHEELQRKAREAEIAAAEARAIEDEKQKQLNIMIDNRRKILTSIWLTNNKYYLNPENSFEFSELDILHLDDVKFHDAVMKAKDTIADMNGRYQLHLDKLKEEELAKEEQMKSAQVEEAVIEANEIFNWIYDGEEQKELEKTTENNDIELNLNLRLTSAEIIAIHTALENVCDSMNPIFDDEIFIRLEEKFRAFSSKNKN